MHTLDDNDNSTETDIYYLPNSDIVLFLTFDTVSRNQKPRKSLNRKNNKIIEWARKANSNRNAAWIQYHNYTCVEKVLLSEWIAAHVVVICLMRNQSKQHQIHTNRRRCFCQSLKVNCVVQFRCCLLKLGDDSFNIFCVIVYLLIFFSLLNLICKWIAAIWAIFS